MWNNWGFRILLFVVLSFIFFYTFNAKNPAEKPPSLEYTSRLKQERIAKDKFFKEDGQSPIEKKSAFKGLAYFEIDNAFKVTAELILDNAEKKYAISTTDNKADTLIKFGVAKFTLGGKVNQLTLFKTENSRLFFLPFRDLTSGKQTYGGGRYLDVPQSDMLANKVVLDFNLAYQPYCAYNYTYICPVPPLENVLNIEITAGEKLIQEIK